MLVSSCVAQGCQRFRQHDLLPVIAQATPWRRIAADSRHLPNL